MSPSTPPPDDFASRVQSVEEELGFTDRKVDILSQEVERVFAEIKRLKDRLNVIERRMNMLGHDMDSSAD